MIKLNDELLNESWKIIFLKSFKWIFVTLFNYGFIALAILLIFIFIYGGVRGGKFVDGPGFLIKKGKTINLTKTSENTSIEDIKEIDETISFLKDLKAQAGKKK